jgi:ssDNA-binding Zn-finger/Zn-ribbon topoisomerase 1
MFTDPIGRGGENHMEENEEEEVDGLCPECGHGFKVFVDRVLKDGKRPDDHVDQPCPVCGCGECKIGK